MRVAIVGSGPSGLYAVRSLLESSTTVSIDVFDRLPAPYGLVRYGVAPDHPKMRTVIRVLRESFHDSNDVGFFGNVAFGRDLTHRDLRDHYHTVVYATGTQADRTLDIPGEDLAGSCSAREFVDWYCGHPDTADRDFDLHIGQVAVVGAGNVALDVARMLAKGYPEIATTDVPDRVLRALRTSEVTDIHVFARRGAAHAKYTPIELREMGKLVNADVLVRPDELVVDADGEARMAASRQVRQNVEMLRDWSSRTPEGRPRRVHLRFLRSPVRILGAQAVAGLVVERNEPGDDGRVVGTGERESVEAGLVLRAVGYRAHPLPDVQFDPVTSTVPHARGRVLDETGRPVPGDYVVGWAKRGPTGVIGTNKSDAAETVASILEDAPRLVPPPYQAREHLRLALARRGVRFTTWPGWLRLDAYERELGRAQARERVRVADRQLMLDVSDDATP
ncbi:MAG: NADP oxidoreductase [Streptosporangiales bacterium]|nr:NADP oxidoreductase [Streptosporangiales bacterium]